MALLRSGTIRQVIEVKKKGLNAALNVLDLPLGDSNCVGVPPCFDDMATEEYVTRKLPRRTYAVWDDEEKEILRSFRYERMWGTISNKFAASWTHVDDAGLATSTGTLTGGKLWAVMTRKDGLTAESIHLFDDWVPKDIPGEDKVRFEMIYLPPKCVL